MDIKLQQIKIRDIIEGYSYSEEEGIKGYGGRLDIRPAYQREFVYKDKEKELVIDTIYNGLPLNVFYWAKNGEDRYELIDGQQRTLSICEYINNAFSYKDRYYHNLLTDEIDRILDYELMVYVCEGTESEKLSWFDRINTAGVKLTNQELLNATFTGPWLSDAKKYFSKRGCMAERFAESYMSGTPIRQDYLETVLKWISDNDIKKYMSEHQHDLNASELWRYFHSVITWVETIFERKRPKLMKGVNWGELYNKYSEIKLDSKVVEKEIEKLLLDDDVTNKKGIYPYILDRNEKHLSIRAFTESQKMTVYERQKGICAVCGNHFDIDEMETDHITPWSLGGKTILSNAQVLCKECNRHKSNK